MRAIAFSLISFVWSSINAGVALAHKLGFLKRHRLSAARVISVGNIQAGGAGKTPMVAKIAIEAADRGLSVCILSRGYRGDWEHGTGEGVGVIAPGDSPRAQDCGDEAALLHLLAPRAWIGVGADRMRQYAQCRKRHGKDFDLVILDDGFQHWKIARDLDIVLFTGASKLGIPFREFDASLRRADLIVLSKGARGSPVEGKPCVSVDLVPRPALLGTSAENRPGEVLGAEGESYWFVAGVARPEEAARTLEAAGFHIRKLIERDDHARYGADEVRGLIDDAIADGSVLALTGKDWVKWKELGVRPDVVQVFEPQVEFRSGREIWNRQLWGS